MTKQLYQRASEFAARWLARYHAASAPANLDAWTENAARICAQWKATQEITLQWALKETGRRWPEMSLWVDAHEKAFDVVLRAKQRLGTTARTARVVARSEVIVTAGLLGPWSSADMGDVVIAGALLSEMLSSDGKFDAKGPAWSASPVLSGCFDTIADAIAADAHKDATNVWRTLLAWAVCKVKCAEVFTSFMRDLVGYHVIGIPGSAFGSLRSQPTMERVRGVADGSLGTWDSAWLLPPVVAVSDDVQHESAYPVLRLTTYRAELEPDSAQTIVLSVGDEPAATDNVDTWLAMADIDLSTGGRG